MMAASSRSQVISLYKAMVKASSRFPSYNYRTYALRRVRDAFRANRKVDDPKAVEKLVEEGEQMLALIQRQDAPRVLLTGFQNRTRMPPGHPGDTLEPPGALEMDLEEQENEVSIGKMYGAQRTVVE